MSTLYDEIVVMFVSEDRAVTQEMFKGYTNYTLLNDCFSLCSYVSRTPFLVRRGRILRALNWLKQNNRLYHDITIDEKALAEYPDDDDGHIPFPVQHQVPNDSIRGQSATYTGHGVDTTEAMFAGATDLGDPGKEGSVPLSVTGTFDVQDTSVSLKLRKLEALKHIKSGGAFVKSSTSDDTLSTRHNPDVYGALWPTLFPYGVGMFDDPLRFHKTDEFRFKSIYLKSHVRGYLQLSDRRFQTHLSFQFVMHNIMMLRASSYESRVAVRRPWWPKAMDAMAKIDENTLEVMEKALLLKKERKDYSRYVPASEAEEAVVSLMRYLDLVSHHIEGSNAEVTTMREEMRALTRDSGTPSLFFTLNPADTYNPLCSFLAGKDIDLNALFDKPDSRFTTFDRARTLADNPTAGAEFFKLMVDSSQVFSWDSREISSEVFSAELSTTME
jgi:hypothetical protein